ncbi:hypothetical protein J3R82DRAFT_2715 [Butyriboletus roseoflavus]|nr:hypothetical protein J3R82DRAFT_2715 [Butyriboletus roseoflavus]
MFPYKFSPASQKKDTNQVGATFGNLLKRSNFDVTTNAVLDENTPKRGFDGSFSQSLSSRHVEPHALGSSAYPRHTQEMIDNKPSATGISSRLKDEPIDAEIGLNSRAFTSSTLSLRDYPKRFIQASTQELDPNPSVGEITAETLFGPVAGKYAQLQKEWAQQREHITDLESRLAAKNEENATLSRNLSQIETTHQQVMNKHRDALGRAAKNYSVLKCELDEFKFSTESSSLFMSEAKATMESLVALRDSTQISLRDFESIFDNDGRLVLTAETREVVHDLRSELSKTQQVADLLRDKLHSMGSDLAEARARILELEASTTTDRNRSESTALKIRQSADQMVEVTRYLQEQKHESVQATAKAYEMEQQLVHAQTRLQEAQSVIASMREEMTAREELHEEQGAKLRTLRHTIEFQEGNVKTHEARARRAEEDLVKALNHNHELQGRLDSAKGLEKNLTQQASRLLSERDEAKDKLQSIERQLAEVQACEISLSSDMAKTLIERNALVDKLKSFDDVKREVDTYREKYAECQVSWKVLQERFDDQCVTLAASKESIGELQERLHATERQATEMSIESKREIIHLQEQNGVLKSRLDRSEKELEAKTASFQAVQIELSRREGAFQTLLETERLGKDEAFGQVQEAKIKVESLLVELAQKEHHAQDMAKRLAAVEAPSIEREREVASLKVRIADLEATEKRLADRAMTISRRYENNDLNDDEKALIALLMQKARAIHDREMVDKTNEIKRPAESTMSLGRHLQKVLTNKVTQWPSMSQSRKDHRPIISRKPAALGHEGRSTNAPHGAADGASVNPSTPGPSSRSTGYSIFAKLCREDTDDIADFEDENLSVATGKRVTFADDVEDGSSRPARRVVHPSVLSRR